MSDVRAALGRIRSWGEARDWRGYDPYDALTSPLSPALTLGTPLGRRFLTQAVKLSPFNLRPLLGIQPQWNAKAMALVASGYARLAAADGDAAARRDASRWLEWLVNSHSGHDGRLAWGYHFDVQTRFFFYRRATPNAIATCFAAQALLDGCELLGEERWQAPARATARFLVDELLAEGETGPYFRYLRGEDDLVHNANALACAVLVRAARVTGADELREVAACALATSLAAQRPDGSWPYAERAGESWVDNFHTAYLLASLAECRDAGPTVVGALERGTAYWERELFLSDGTPRYTPAQTLPLDAHCYATAIDTWLTLGRREEAERVAVLLIDQMLDPAGYVHFQQRKLWTSRVPLVRWSTAPSFHALAHLLLARERLA